MAPDIELDRLTRLLRQCLGRIDEAAFQCQTDGSEIDHESTIERLGVEAEQLQGLVSTLVDAAGRAPEAAESDVNLLVQQTVQQVLHSCETPVVLRSRLANSLPAAGCRPGHLALALHRALQLGIAHTGHGGRIEVATRHDEGQVVFELLAEGSGNPETANRAATLAEFVAGWGGRVRVDRDEQGELLLSLELPTADVYGDRQSD